MWCIPTFRERAASLFRDPEMVVPVFSETSVIIRQTVRCHMTSVNNIYRRHLREYVTGVCCCIAVCNADEGRHWGVLYQSVWLSIKIVISTLYSIDFLFSTMFSKFRCICMLRYKCPSTSLETEFVIFFKIRHESVFKSLMFAKSGQRVAAAFRTIRQRQPHLFLLKRDYMFRSAQTIFMPLLQTLSK
jgi:hypothetical protein